MALTLPARNCAGDRFTATVRCSGQVAAVRHASRNTHAPILSMSRRSSATGMNTNGGIRVPSSARQAYQRLEADETALRYFEESADSAVRSDHAALRRGPSSRARSALAARRPSRAGRTGRNCGRRLWPCTAPDRHFSAVAPDCCRPPAPMQHRRSPWQRSRCSLNFIGAVTAEMRRCAKSSA